MDELEDNSPSQQLILSSEKIKQFKFTLYKGNTGKKEKNNKQDKESIKLSIDDIEIKSIE